VRALEEIRKKLQHEIVQREAVQESLRQLQRQYEVIFNSVSDGIHGLDIDENIIFANPRAAELLGWSVHELLGRPAHCTIHHHLDDGSEYPISACPVHISMRDGNPRRVTNDLFWRKDGSSFRVEYLSVPVYDEDGRVTGSIVVFKDMTERAVSEARLKLQAQQYRLLFETNPCPMWVFDTGSLQILAVNEAALAQYGYSREEFRNLTMRELQPSDDVPDIVKAVTSPEAPAHFNGQTRHIRKDGSTILVGIYSAGIVWEGAEARIVTAIDISERQRSQK
jgi:PAS domain S-box-containing protein